MSTKKRSFLNNIFVRNFIALIIVSVMLVAGVLIWLNYYTQHGKAVEVPDVRGMSIEKAEPFFTKSKLNYIIIDSVFNKNAIPGSIAETTPPVGLMVKEGRTIYVKINSYMPHMISIPDVVDSSKRQALAMLQALGFEKIDSKIVPGPDAEIVLGLESRGVVLTAGQRVYADTPLSLLVSSGEAYIHELLDDFTIENQGDSSF